MQDQSDGEHPADHSDGAAVLNSSPSGCDPGRSRDRGRGRPPAMSATDRADRIFDALDAVFDRAGLEGTTMTAIAAEAGMSKRTLYAIFDDRAAVFAAYLARIREEFVHELTPEERLLPLEARLRRLLLPMPRSRPSGLPMAVLRIAIGGGETLSGPIRACLAGFVQRDRALIRAELDLAVSRGEARLVDTEQSAAILEAMVRPSIGDALLDRLDCPDTTRKVARFEAGLAMFLAAVGCPADARTGRALGAVAGESGARRPVDGRDRPGGDPDREDPFGCSFDRSGES